MEQGGHDTKTAQLSICLGHDTGTGTTRSFGWHYTAANQKSDSLLISKERSDAPPPLAA